MVLVTRPAARRRSEQGMIAVLTALMALALLAFAALVVDLGHVRDVRRQAQNTADSAALAAGNNLYLDSASPRMPTRAPQITQAVAAAQAYATANLGVTPAQWAACTDPGRPAGFYVPASSTPCISFDQATTPVEVRVKLPVTSVDTPLGGLLGRNRVDVVARANAKLTPNPKSKCALCILGSGLHDLQNGDATASGGDITFNGSVNVNSNGLVATDGAINVQNTASGSYMNYDPDPTTGVPPITDPLGFLALPPNMGPPMTLKSNPCTDGPGFYGTYNFPNSTCTLSPGLYVIAGGTNTWMLNGNDSQVLTGTGVTLYFTCGTPSAPAPCASGVAGASMDATGNGHITIQAPTSGPLQGLAFVFDRNSTATFKMAGTAASGMKGTMYLPHGTLLVSGTSCANIDSLIVVGDLAMNGNGACLQSSYLPNDNTTFPPDTLRLSR